MKNLVYFMFLMLASLKTYAGGCYGPTCPIAPHCPPGYFVNDRNYCERLPSQIVCQYSLSSGSTGQLILEAVDPSVNLAAPWRSSVDFYVNGSKHAETFLAKTTGTRDTTAVTFSKRNPIFVSDISVTHTNNFFNGESFTGSWTTDTAVLPLVCRFNKK